MWLQKQEPIKVSYHPAKFGSQKHHGSKDVMILVCYVILSDDVIKKSFDFIGQGSSRKVTI